MFEDKYASAREPAASLRRRRETTMTQRRHQFRKVFLFVILVGVGARDETCISYLCECVCVNIIQVKIGFE